MTTFIIVFAVIAIILALWGISNLIAVAGGSPPVHTPMQTCYEILKKSGVSKKDTLLDLGAGTGNMITCASKYFGTRAIGYEISPMPYLQAKMRQMFSNTKTHIYFASIFEAKLSDANIIFLYLLPKMLLTLAPKLKQECRPGTLIITRGFPLPGMKAIKQFRAGKEKTKIFLYRVK